MLNCVTFVEPGRASVRLDETPEKMVEFLKADPTERPWHFRILVINGEMEFGLHQGDSHVETIFRLSRDEMSRLLAGVSVKPAG